LGLISVSPATLLKLMREVIGCKEGYMESKESWRAFLLRLHERALSGVCMFSAGKFAGMLGAIQEVFLHAM
jgi:putative transposase